MIMKVNGKEYIYRVEPHFDCIRAEILEVRKGLMPRSYEVAILSREFGSFFRKPTEKDYKAASKWAKDQLKLIEEANESTLNL